MHTATGLHPEVLSRLFARPIETARNYSPASRKNAAASGAAMVDGSYPIYNAADVKNAVDDYNRTGQAAAVKAHIEKRAKVVGAKPPFED